MSKMEEKEIRKLLTTIDKRIEIRSLAHDSSPLFKRLDKLKFEDQLLILADLETALEHRIEVFERIEGKHE